MDFYLNIYYWTELFRSQQTVCNKPRPFPCLQHQQVQVQHASKLITPIDGCKINLHKNDWGFFYECSRSLTEQARKEDL
jgi:hypothetical protein